jgi:hypothetical protein
VAVRPQRSFVGDVEKGLHGMCVLGKSPQWRRWRTLRACFFKCKCYPDERSSHAHDGHMRMRSARKAVRVGVSALRVPASHGSAADNRAHR